MTENIRQGPAPGELKTCVPDLLKTGVTSVVVELQKRWELGRRQAHPHSCPTIGPKSSGHTQPFHHKGEISHQQPVQELPAPHLGSHVWA